MLDLWTETVPLWAVFALEAANFAMLLYVSFWVNRAGNRIVDSIAMRLGLRTGYKGKNPSILDTLKGFLPAKPQEQEGQEEPVPQSELELLAKKYLGTSDPKQIESAARNYL